MPGEGVEPSRPRGGHPILSRPELRGQPAHLQGKSYERKERHALRLGSVWVDWDRLRRAWRRSVPSSVPVQNGHAQRHRTALHSTGLSRRGPFRLPASFRSSHAQPAPRRGAVHNEPPWSSCRRSQYPQPPPCCRLTRATAISTRVRVATRSTCAERSASRPSPACTHNDGEPPDGGSRVENFTSVLPTSRVPAPRLNVKSRLVANPSHRARVRG